MSPVLQIDVQPCSRPPPCSFRLHGWSGYSSWLRQSGRPHSSQISSVRRQATPHDATTSSDVISSLTIWCCWSAGLRAPTQAPSSNNNFHRGAAAFHRQRVPSQALDPTCSRRGRVVSPAQAGEKGFHIRVYRHSIVDATPPPPPSAPW